MNRRAFIAVFGGAAAWPLVARAQQQPERLRRVGVLEGIAKGDLEPEANLAAFRQELEQFGWKDSRNLRFDVRFGAGDAERIRKDAAELVSLAPDVVLAVGPNSVAALLDVTHTVPIVFVLVPDPVGAGFVDSQAEPGGNATGFLMFEYSLAGKWLELLKEISPRMTRVAVLRDLDNCWHRPVCCHPIGCAIIGCGPAPHRRARSSQYRTLRRGLRQPGKWRHDRDCEHFISV